MLQTVLVVEDDKFTRQLLRSSLERHELCVLEAATAARAVDIVQQHATNIVLLDLYLPDEYGLAIVPKIKHHTDAPIIVVSGEHSEAVQVNCFESGVDDYVEKPFGVNVIGARINAHLRRLNSMKQPAIQGTASTKSANLQCLGGFTLDPAKYLLADKNGNPIDLSAGEFAVLEYMARHSGQVLKREDICEAMREHNYTPSTRALDVKIARLRKKIGDNDPHKPLIKTLRGIGYMLDAQS